MTSCVVSVRENAFRKKFEQSIKISLNASVITLVPVKRLWKKSQVLCTTIWNENGRERRQDWLNIFPRVLRTHFMTMVQLHVEARSKAASGFLSRRGHNDAVSLNLFVDVYGDDS